MLKRILKVGDKVRVVQNLNTEMVFNGYVVTSSMLGLKGQVVTIKQVYEIYGQPVVYKLEGSSQFIYWTPEMLEDINQKAIIRIAFNGTATIVKVDDKQGIALCNPNVDLYDENEGIRIAVCRALDIDPFKLEEPIVKELKDYSTEEILEELAKKVN